MIAALATCVLLAVAAPQRPGLDQRQGVTVPLDRKLQDELATARDFLEQGKADAAVAILQQVLEAPASSLVESGSDGDLLVGASVVARELLDQLDAEAARQRNNFVARSAEQDLAEALVPPDPIALQRLAARYVGTPVGERAALALEDLAVDRGLALVEPGEQPLLVPWIDSLEDPSLPTVEARGLRPIWRFDFADPSIARTARGHRMVFSEGVGFVTNGVEVAAIRLGDGHVLWNFEGPPGWDQISLGEFDEITGGESDDFLTIPVLEDGVLLVVLREAFGVGRKDTFDRRRNNWRSIDVRRKLPARRLYAFDAESGRLLWRTEPAWLENRDTEPRGLTSAPPAAAHGRVFLPLYDAVGTIDLSMQAYDLYTGEKLWRTFLVSGQQETNLFGNILRELSSQPPVADDDHVYFSTNLGAVVCLEADTGRTVWTRRYPRSAVRTFQTGMESVRDETFANTPMAAGKNRLVLAPADSEAAFVLRQEDGALLAEWPYASRSYGELRTLIGVTDKGAWFHGTHLAFLPFPGSGASLRVSEQLFTPNGTAPTRYGGALARGEILAPSLGTVQILDAQQLRPRGRLKGVGTRGLELGPLQVAPGLAFIIRPGGITAFSSPDAILKSLAGSNWDSEAVERLLPYLESVDLSDPVTARKVADRARDLANSAPTPELKERLAMVAARGSFVAGQGQEALALLRPLLNSTTEARRVRAAELSLDVLERTDPTHPAMDEVLAILEADPNRRVLRFDGSLERKELAVARARVLQTGKRDFGSEEHLDALLRLLMQDGLDNLRQGNLSLAEWARLQVQSALRDPKLAERVERRARIAFEAEPPSDSLMQRFAGTQTAWEWLRDRARAVGDDRAQALRLASWLRGYAWPQADRAELSELLPMELLVGAGGNLALPASLDTLAQLELGRARLIDFGVFEGRLIVLAQADVNCYLVELSADDQYQGSPHRLAESRSSLPDLRGQSFVHGDGAALLVGDRWLSLPLRDGQRQEFQLSGKVESGSVLRFGELLAFLCARGDGGLELEVRDLRSPTRLLSLPLPLRDDRFHTLAWNGDRLLVLQDGSEIALQVPLFARGEVERTGLITGPSTHELERLIPLPDGLVLPYSSRGQKLLWVLRDGQEEALLQRPQHDLRTFRAPTGFGWLQSPLAPDPNRDDGPVLFWNGAAEAQGRTFPFGSEEVRFPQLESYSREREDFATDRLLTTHPTEDGTVQIRAWRLPESGDPVASWELTLEDIPFDRLVGRLPAPVAHDRGWLIPLKLLNSRTAAPRLILLLVNAKGELVDRLELEAPGNSSLRIQPVLGDGFAALRHESRLYLLGGK